jgi:predicted nucleic acid-binding protein
MSDKSFVDTNIFAYAYDRAGGTKHEKAQRLVASLWESGTGALSTQVLQELAVCLRHKVATVTPQETRRVLEELMTWSVFVNATTSVFHALETEQRYQISFWDSMIVQAAERSGAEILYTEGLSHGQNYGPVRAVNPFLD